MSLSIGAVIGTLLNFVTMFKRAHQENCKQLELEKKKAEKEAQMEKSKGSTKNTKDGKDVSLINSPRYYFLTIFMLIYIEVGIGPLELAPNFEFL